MLLLIDIGNSSTTFGISKGGNKYITWYSPTETIKSKAAFKKISFLNLKKKKIDPNNVQAVIICSVVPKINNLIKSFCRDIFKKSKFYVIGKDILVPIANKYKNPKQVGNDRLVNALAAKANFKPPVIVVDFGTAITLDVISKTGEYLGGVIVPGINLSLKVLYENTALLPYLNPRKPKAVLGTDTGSSILSGIFYGYSFLVDGLIQKLKATLKNNALVVATGGNINIMKPLCKEIDSYKLTLTLEGIEKAYNLAINRGK